MIEIPEASVLAEQCTEVLAGKVVQEVIVGQSPHKFAWYVGDPEDYAKKLMGKTFGSAHAFGGFVEIEIEDVFLAFSDGIQLSYLEANQKKPKKHQLLIRFSDHSHLVASVRMYGGMWCFRQGEWDNIYYQLAKEKPSPLTDDFSLAYFQYFIHDDGLQKLSVKALLATEQRIPGLGNGVLQDILFDAGIHPKKKIYDLTKPEIDKLYYSIRSVLAAMTAKGGRDTEKDLLGAAGEYGTKMSRKTVGQICPECTGRIEKQSYMGGSIYFCPTCQKI